MQSPFKLVKVDSIQFFFLLCFASDGLSHGSGVDPGLTLDLTRFEPDPRSDEVQVEGQVVHEISIRFRFGSRRIFG